MRHKYASLGIVLARSPLAEASTLVTLLTKDFGLVRARAQGLRKSGAKLAPALQTLTSASVTLLHGKEGWRLAGALLEQNWYRDLTPAARERAGRIASLILRLVSGESGESSLYELFETYLEALPGKTDDEQDALEILAALYILHALGLDAGTLPQSGYDTAAIQETLSARKDFVLRINRGIQASGL